MKISTSDPWLTGLGRGHLTLLHMGLIVLEILLCLGPLEQSWQNLCRGPLNITTNYIY